MSGNDRLRLKTHLDRFGSERIGSDRIGGNIIRPAADRSDMWTLWMCAIFHAYGQKKELVACHVTVRFPFFGPSSIVPTPARSQAPPSPAYMYIYRYKLQYIYRVIKKNRVLGQRSANTQKWPRQLSSSSLRCKLVYL